MNEKLCVFCEHLAFVTNGCVGDYYVGDVINSAGVDCLKGVWSIGGDAGDQPFNGYDHIRRHQGFEIQFAKGELAEAIRKAKTCKHYSPPKTEPPSQEHD